MSDFESYCSRMWLDYCDENNTLHSECLSKDAYVERWYEWLLDRWQNRNYKDAYVSDEDMDYSGAFESDIVEDSCGGTPEGWISEKNFKKDIIEDWTSEKRDNKDKALLEAWQNKEDKDTGYQPYPEEDPLSIQEEIDLFRTDPNS